MTPPSLDQLLDGIHARTLRDRITQPLADKEWVWHKLLGKGELGYIHGMGGLSKSLLTQAMFAQRANPAYGFLLDLPVSPGITRALDAENDDSIVDYRLRRLGVAADTAGLVYDTVDTGLLGQAQHAGLLDELLEHLITEVAATLLILDSWGTLWGLDEIDQPAVQQFFDSLNRVRKRTGCAIALIGHDNRKGDYRGLALIHNNVQSRIHLKPTREQDDEDEPVTDITIRHKKQRAGALIRPIPFTVTWSAHRIALTSTATHAGKLEHVVRYIQDAGGELVPTRTLTTQFGLGRNWVSDHADMLHACGLERDNEVDPRQSSGWRIRLPQHPQNSDPSHRDRSTMRVCDLPGETPQTPKDRITMRVCDLPGDVPPTGVSNTPPQGRVEREPTATPIDPEVNVPSDSELAILAELDEMVANGEAEWLDVTHGDRTVTELKRPIQRLAYRPDEAATLRTVVVRPIPVATAGACRTCARGVYVGARLVPVTRAPAVARQADDPMTDGRLPLSGENTKRGRVQPHSS